MLYGRTLFQQQQTVSCFSERLHGGSIAQKGRNPSQMWEREHLKRPMHTTEDGVFQSLQESHLSNWSQTYMHELSILSSVTVHQPTEIILISRGGDVSETGPAPWSQHPGHETNAGIISKCQSQDCSFKTYVLIFLCQHHWCLAEGTAISDCDLARAGLKDSFIQLHL